jgi:L-threonylcarbamoyladenylate synthase
MKTLRLWATHLEKAAEILRSGGLVAFPTETVYGLGANALDEASVKKIFTAKWRPADNPLIVHIAKKEDVEIYAQNIPPLATILIEEFWPGALTLVLEKKDIIPDATTAWLSTVCLRMPSHPLALKLIEDAGVPLAAPSANTSGRPSPTSADHVYDDMNGKIDAIIEGDIPEIGIESTVLDLTVTPPVILRHGWITEEMILEFTALGNLTEGFEIKAPGMKYRHYAPNVELMIVTHAIIPEILTRIERGENIGFMWVGVTEQIRENIFLFPSIEAFSKHLFTTFRASEKMRLSTLYVEDIGEIWLGKGIMNRARKAASGN